MEYKGKQSLWIAFFGKYNHYVDNRETNEGDKHQGEINPCDFSPDTATEFELSETREGPLDGFPKQSENHAENPSSTYASHGFNASPVPRPVLLME